MAKLSQQSRFTVDAYDLNSAAAGYDIQDQLFGRQPGQGPDFTPPQFGATLRCQFGR
jgi:hypothetical protein